jgi:hypothetical protein
MVEMGEDSELCSRLYDGSGLNLVDRQQRLLGIIQYLESGSLPQSLGRLRRHDCLQISSLEKETKKQKPMPSPDK